MTAASALVASIGATSLAFSQTHAELWSVPMAARWRRVISSSSASKTAVVAASKATASGAGTPTTCR